MTQAVQPPNGGQMFFARPTIAGITLSDGQDTRSVRVGVLSPPKGGKSTLATTLFGWPTPEKTPLVLAFDRTGPESCIRLGYMVNAIKVQELLPSLPPTGQKTWAPRTKAAIDLIASNLPAIKQQYGSIVIDCVSTACARWMQDEVDYSNNPDGRAHYGETMKHLSQLVYRLEDFGLPTIWLGWQAEQEVHTEGSGKEKKTKLIEGGFSLPSKKMVAFVGGQMGHICILEKVKFGVGQPNTDPEGYLRKFHTTSHNGVIAGGRHQHKLPAEMPAHLGMVLTKITGLGPQEWK